MSSAIWFHCSAAFPGGKRSRRTVTSCLPGERSRRPPRQPAPFGAIVTGWHPASVATRPPTPTTSSCRPPFRPPASPSRLRVWRSGPLRPHCSALRRSGLDSWSASDERGAGIPGARPDRDRPRRHRDEDRLADRSGRCSRCSCSIQASSCRRTGSSTCSGRGTHRRPAESSGSTSRSCGGSSNLGGRRMPRAGCWRRSRPAISFGSIRISSMQRASSASQDAARPLLEDEPARAGEMLRTPLALWRGDHSQDVLHEDAVSPEVARLNELRLARGGGPARGRSRARAGWRPDPRARGPRRGTSVPRAPPRPAHARLLPRRTAGGCARWLPRRRGARSSRSSGSSRASGWRSSTGASSVTTRALAGTHSLPCPECRGARSESLSPLSSLTSSTPGRKAEPLDPEDVRAFLSPHHARVRSAPRAVRRDGGEAHRRDGPWRCSAPPRRTRTIQSARSAPR